MPLSMPQYCVAERGIYRVPAAAAVCAAIAALLLALTPAAPAAAQSSAGEQAVRAVYNRWNKATWKTLTFVQETQYPGRASEMWYESLKPGMLRIDLTPGDSTHRVLLFRNDSVYQGSARRPMAGRPYVHPLMVLFTDVATASPDVTAAKLAKMGFDLTKSRTDSFMGKPVLVIGAGPGDSTSSQFWIEQDRQLVVRVMEKPQRAGEGMSDIQVVKHERAGDGWVESDIVFYTGGEMTQRELYSDIRINVPLDEAIFAPGNMALPSWVPPYLKR